MSRTNFKELLEAGVHFGHLKKKWNPGMPPYVARRATNKIERIEYLTKKGIPTAIFYKKPFNQLDNFNKLIFGKYDVSLKLSKITKLW